MGQLGNKTAIITGASSGIGKGTALAFAREGCSLVLTARTASKLEETAQQCRKLGAKAVWYAGDAGLEDTAEKTVRLALETFGKVDILVNNAGIGKVETIENTTMEDYDTIMNTNVRSAVAFTIKCIPSMLERHEGIIINVSSISGIIGHEDESVYTASKFALRGFTQAIDKELWSRGIKATCICPYAMKTGFEVGNGRDAQEIAKLDWGTGEDVGEAILFAATRPGSRRVHEIVFS